jgi:hypothetical protein
MPLLIRAQLHTFFGLRIGSSVNAYRPAGKQEKKKAKGEKNGKIEANGGAVVRQCGFMGTKALPQACGGRPADDLWALIRVARQADGLRS